MATVKQQAIVGALLIGLIATACVWPMFSRSVPGAGFIIGSCVIWLAVGIAVRADQRRRSLGNALIITGALWTLQWSGVWHSGLAALSIIPGTLLFIALAYTVLSYPPDLARTRVEYTFLFIFIPYFVGTSIFATVVARPDWLGFAPQAAWLTIWPDRELFELAVDLASIGDPLSAVVITMLCIIRLSRMSKLDRAVIAPLLFGLCGSVLIASTASSEGNGWYTSSPSEFVLGTAAIFLIPLGFVAAEVRNRIQHASVITKLNQKLLDSSGASDALQESLRSSFADPEITIYYWSEKSCSFVDGNGRSVDVDALPTGQTQQHMFDGDEQPLALLRGSNFLERHPQSLELAIHTSRFALENARLQASVQHQLHEVELSRSRIVEAGLRERRRMERDLHDGVQQNLLGMGIQLGLLRKQLNDDSPLDEIEDNLHKSIRLLRGLAHGISPPVLQQFGLSAAIAEAAERSGIPTELNVTQERYPDNIESTAHFVICEGLANAMKHSNASQIAISVTETDDALRVVLSDNGVGGADANGSGLTSLADRIAALHGTFGVKSNGEGTELRATIPIVA